jgi:NADH:ubiquinone oxidoreductase subunit K
MKNMKIQKLLTKYAIFLLVYIAIVRFLQPYGINLYYTLRPDPESYIATAKTMQAVLSVANLFLNLIFVVFIIIDSKNKKAIDWLIAIITLFTAETGIILFLLWQVYKEYKKNTIHNIGS